MKINEVTSPLSKINKFLSDKKRKEEYARKLQRQRDAEEPASVEEAYPAQQISRYNPDSETYRNGTGGGRIPNSKSISKSDITAKGKQVDFPDGAYDATQFDNVSKKEMEKNIADVLDTLTKTEQTVLKARFGLEPFDRDYTLGEIGDAMGVGGERIRQIEAKALRKLKHPSRSRKVRSYVGEDFGSVPPLAELILMAVVAKTSVDVLKGMFKTAIATGKGLKKLNALRKKVANIGQGVADYAMPNESISKDDLHAKIKSKQQSDFYAAALTALDRLVKSSGDKQSVGGYAFDIARAFNGINAKELVKMYNAD
jgi:RNA polymerase sigma factor (sigma-70 family)